jgi:hypothetical protein
MPGSRARAGSWWADLSSNSTRSYCHRGDRATTLTRSHRSVPEHGRWIAARSYNLESGRYFGLNPMGARMVAVLSASESIQAAHDTLLREYDVDSGRLQRDLDTLIQRLLEHGLIEVSGG